MQHLIHHIEQHLGSYAELTSVCSPNNHIDQDSLHYEIIKQNDYEIILLVQFQEIVSEGSGHAGRISCEGYLRLTLDRYGQIVRSQLL